MACSEKLLGKFRADGSRGMCNMHTGDSTWVFFYGIDSRLFNQMSANRQVVLSSGF